MAPLMKGLNELSGVLAIQHTLVRGWRAALSSSSLPGIIILLGSLCAIDFFDSPLFDNEVARRINLNLNRHSRRARLFTRVHRLSRAGDLRRIALVPTGDAG